MEHQNTEKLVVYYQSRHYIEHRKHRKVAKKDRVYFSNLAEFCDSDRIPVTAFDWILYQFMAYRKMKYGLAPKNLLSEKAVKRTLSQLHEMERKLGVNSLPITAELEMKIFMDRIKSCMQRYEGQEMSLRLLIGLNQDYITPAQFDYAWTRSGFNPKDSTYLQIHDKYLVSNVDVLRSLLLNEEV